jgi:hypothetical protein
MRQEKQELNKIENENRRENTEEWEMKGRVCWPSHYPSSTYFFLCFHIQRVFWSGGENAKEKDMCELLNGHRAMKCIVTRDY